eukprot:TRINITY_DN3414_c0_g1_i1.p4 TRINITY_DN3414_c0_g1~~TRINITY_DN3414_c0_g1_i1.p4  ORF type:complete len:57 (+),score=4.10 TRINITY_DN3414_c0_g1_i1:578-748(+)
MNIYCKKRPGGLLLFLHEVPYVLLGFCPLVNRYAMSLQQEEWRCAWLNMTLFPAFE